MDIITAISESAKELGYDHLKQKQLEVAVSLLSGNDTFISLPTGYGKFIIYALLPSAFDKYKGKVTGYSLFSSRL